MKTKYTKKQILESIKYWEKQLKTMSESYSSFNINHDLQMKFRAKLPNATIKFIDDDPNLPKQLQISSKYKPLHTDDSYKPVVAIVLIKSKFSQNELDFDDYIEDDNGLFGLNIDSSIMNELKNFLVDAIERKYGIDKNDIVIEDCCEGLIRPITSIIAYANH